MNNLLDKIKERAYAAAQKRGKDVTPSGCKAALQEEINEYWDAVEGGKPTNFWRDIVSKAAQQTDKAFVDMYAKRVHNTTTDELADILITTATWSETIRYERTATGDPYFARRDLELALTNGPIKFIEDQLDTYDDKEELVNIVYLKLRYNELRED